MIQIAALPAGAYDLNVTDGVRSGSATFTILNPVLTLFPGVGHVSSNLTANGTGFRPEDAVTLTFNTTVITTCEPGTSLLANGVGNFSCTFQVPALSVTGLNSVDASDGVNTAAATYSLNRPTLSLTPANGNVGSKVTATGLGFAIGAALSITFGTTTISRCSAGSTSANAFGDLSCSFAVPTLAAGTYLVNASDSVNSAPSASFVIGPPFLSLSVTRGTVGTSTTATGSGFTPSGPVTLLFNSTPITTCLSGQLTASDTGGFSCAFATPAGTAGPQTVQASDSVNTAAASFQVTASLALSEPNGSFNEVVNASGTGFDGDASVVVSWNTSYQLCSAVTGVDGSFSCLFSVPTAPMGSHTVTATERENAPTAPFRVDPAVLLSSSSRVVGQPEIASGYGFEPLQSISVLWDHLTPECSGSSTNSNGAVTCAFLVPATPGGEHNVSALQGVTEVNQSLTVTAAFSIAPPTGVVGINVQLIGTGFQASTVYLACMEAVLLSCPSGSFSFTTEANGSIPTDTNFTVPEESPGSYDLVVSSGSTVAGEASFVVTTATVDLTPTSGWVGTQVTLSGSGFAPDAAYDYCFQAPAASCPSATETEFTTTASGDVPSGISPLTVPASPGGIYHVDVSQGTLLIGFGEFIVLPNVTANATSATVGSKVVIDGTGFPALTSYLTTWNSSVSLCTGITNSTGGFTCTFTVPPASRGAHEVSVTAGSTLVSFTLSVSPKLVLSPANGTVGSMVQVTGGGFDADTAYSVLWNSSATLCSKWTNASGSLACSFPVPTSPAGSQNVSVVEATVTVTAKFVVAPSLGEAPSHGVVGSFAEVTGVGFDARSAFSVSWNSSDVLCSATTNATGGLTCPFSVPVAPGGSNTIVTREGSYALTVEFTVMPSVGISPTKGPVGGSEVVAATGFAPGTAYSFRWNNSAQLCSGSANSNGAFPCDFTVPASPAGMYNLTAIEGGSSVAVQFTIVPSFVISPTTGTVGSAVRMSGGGFDADSSFTFEWNNPTTQLCSGTTSGNGNLSCTFLVPNAPGGSHFIVLSEGSYSLTIPFTVSPSVSISQLNATPGTYVTVAGEGFVSGEPFVVSLSPSGGTLCTGTANPNGSFSCTFAVPSVPYGMYQLTVTQGPTDISGPIFVQPLAAPSSSAPFPWWLVAVVLVAVLFGAFVIYLQSRRRPSARPRTDALGEGPVIRPWRPGGKGSPPATVPPGIAPSAGTPSALAATPGTDDSATRLFNRLVPIYREVLNSPPPQADRPSTRPAAPPSKNDVDVLVERLGPIYEEVLKGIALRQVPGAVPVPTSASAEEVKARVMRLVPAYRTILMGKPPQGPK